MAAFVYRLECRLQGRWAQFPGGFDLAACRQTADFLHACDSEPVRVIDNRTGKVVYHSRRRRRR
jgi:hypothetical protein